MIEHTFLEDNKCVNHLAKLRATSNSPLLIITESPFELINLFQANVRGVSVVRM
jgi:hypothetical protein